MFQGQPVADLTSARSETQLKQALDQLLAQLPVTGGADGGVPGAPPGPSPEELAQFVKLGEEALAAADPQRAASIFAQITEFAPRSAMVMPIMPPTHECVVETGISHLVARMSHTAVAMSTHMQPHMSRGGLSLKSLILASEPRMVLTTSPPMKQAPTNSMTTAMQHACFTVSALEPTEVANALATSFALRQKGMGN
jgi:hypothetical protein